MSRAGEGRQKTVAGAAKNHTSRCGSFTFWSGCSDPYGGKGSACQNHAGAYQKRHERVFGTRRNIHSCPLFHRVLRKIPPPQVSIFPSSISPHRRSQRPTNAGAHREEMLRLVEVGASEAVQTIYRPVCALTAVEFNHDFSKLLASKPVSKILKFWQDTLCLEARNQNRTHRL